MNFGPKCITLTTLTYAPAVVLFVWAAVLSEQHRKMSKEQIIFFLIVLGVAVAAAETARITKRRISRRERERRDALSREPSQ